MKKVVYTCLTGNIDTLLQPEIIDKTFDYICFTDKGNLRESTNGIWKIMPIESNERNPVRLSRLPKLLPHLFLEDYEYSLYIDANVKIANCQFYKYVNRHIEQEDLICQLPHPTRDCIYLELEHCYNIRKVSPWQYIRCRSLYTKSSLPKHYGLYENNVILRRHNEEKVKQASEMWWNYYKSLSNRDQLCLMLVYWNLNIKPALLLNKNENSRNSKLIECVSHNQIKSSSRKKPFITRILNKIGRELFVPIYRRIVKADDYHSQW